MLCVTLDGLTHGSDIQFGRVTLDVIRGSERDATPRVNTGVEPRFWF